MIKVRGQREKNTRPGKLPARVEKWLLAVAMVASLVHLAGCGNQNAYKTVRVKGKVVFDDGTPVQGVQLMFVPLAPPVDPKTHARTAIAEIADDGTIVQATTYEHADGIIKGKHKVLIRGGDAIPEKYRSKKTTPLEVDTSDVPFDLKVEKS